MMIRLVSDDAASSVDVRLVKLESVSLGPIHINFRPEEMMVQ